MTQFAERNVLAGTKVQAELIELEGDLVVVAAGEINYMHLGTDGARLLDQTACAENLVVGMWGDHDDPIVGRDGWQYLLRKGGSTSADNQEQNDRTAAHVTCRCSCRQSPVRPYCLG